jgi:hypothetical protein
MSDDLDEFLVLLDGGDTRTLRVCNKMRSFSGQGECPCPRLICTEPDVICDPCEMCARPMPRCVCRGNEYGLNGVCVAHTPNCQFGMIEQDE